MRINVKGRKETLIRKNKKIEFGGRREKGEM
jgi:hypothetical protein